MTLRSEIRRLESLMAGLSKPEPPSEISSEGIVASSEQIPWELLADSFAGFSDALILIDRRLNNLELRAESSEVQGEAAPQELATHFVGASYDDFGELPIELKEKVLPFFFGEPPEPGVLDAIYVSEEGWGASMSSPPIQDPSMRALARVAVLMNSENQEIQRRFLAEAIAREDFISLSSNHEALEVAAGFAHATVRQPQPGVFAVIDLQELYEDRPDFKLREELCEAIVAEITRRGHSHAALHGLWEDSPKP